MSDAVSEQLSDIDSFISDEPVLNASGDVMPEIDTKAFLKDTLMLGFSAIASKAGKHWALADGEADALAGAYDAVLSKYFPDAGKMLGVEVTAITITAMVFLPRYQQSAALKAEVQEPYKVHKASAEGAVSGVDDDVFGFGEVGE